MISIFSTGKANNKEINSKVIKYFKNLRDKIVTRGLRWPLLLE